MYHLVGRTISLSGRTPICDVTNGSILKGARNGKSISHLAVKWEPLLNEIGGLHIPLDYKYTLAADIENPSHSL